MIGYPFVHETPWRSKRAVRKFVGRWQEAGFNEIAVYYPPELGMPEAASSPGFEYA